MPIKSSSYKPYSDNNKSNIRSHKNCDSLYHYLNPTDKLIINKALKIRIHEGRPFSYNDFPEIGHDYFKNRISHLRRLGIVIKDKTSSSVAFYRIIPEVIANWNCDSYPMGVSISPSIDITPILYKLGLEHKAVHRIRLEFKANGLYRYLRDNGYRVNKNNDEIFLDKIGFDSLYRYALVVISPYDLVMVHINSSDEPYPANFEGMTILGNHLYAVYLYLSGIAKIIPITSCLYWIVKEWQANKDAKLYEGSGLFFQGLNFTWKDMQYGLSRIYLKEKADGEVVLRGEHDEKVDKPYLKVLSDVLHSERSYYDERLDEILRLVRTLVDQKNNFS